MEFDFHKAVVIFFGIGATLALIFIILLAFLNHSPDRKTLVDELTEKQERLKKEFHENLIQQAHSLNKMLSTGRISEVEYDIKRAEILDTLKKHNIDDSIIKSIPRAQYMDRKKLHHKRMNIATSLNERGELTDDELNNNINESLDDLK